MSAQDLQTLERTIQGLQTRLGAIVQERTVANRTMADCQVKINRLRSIQANTRNQSVQGAARLRQDLAMWESRFQTAKTRYESLIQAFEATRNQRMNAQARLEQLQSARRMAAAGRGRGGGRRW